LLSALLSDARVETATRFGQIERKAAWILTQLWDYSEMFMAIETKSGFPVSDYLHRILRDPLRRIEPDDRRYSKLFDRFEYLSAICFGDTLGDRNMPIGRFGRQFRYPDAGNVMESIDAELLKNGKKWPPLTGGLCGGSWDNFIERKRQLDESVKNAR